MHNSIPALRIQMEEEERENIRKAITDILHSEIKWTNAAYVSMAEEKFAEMVGLPHCAMVSTGSSAIEAALISLEVENTCIFAPVLTAPATIYSCLRSHSDIVLVDADLESFSLDMDDLEEKINRYYVGKYAAKGAVIVVHVGGIITPQMDRLKELAERYNLYLIEDCAHAHGSRYNNQSAGSWGALGTYSFFLTKTITSGEGGAVVSQDAGLVEKIKQIRNYGKSNEGLHVINGSSWRMNEFTAAVLLNRLHSYNPAIRGHIAAQYQDAFADSAFFAPLKLPEFSISGYYKYILPFRKNVSIDYAKVKSELKEKGIELPARVFDRLVADEPFLHTNRQIRNTDDRFSNARFLAQNHMCLPIYEQLTNQEIRYIVSSVQCAVEHSAGVALC